MTFSTTRLSVRCITRADVASHSARELTHKGKSNSRKGGGGYDEIVIVDGKAGELIRVHAEKDMDTAVLNNDTQFVVVDRTIRIDGNRDQTVKKRYVHNRFGR